MGWVAELLLGIAVAVGSGLILRALNNVEQRRKEQAHQVKEKFEQLHQALWRLEVAVSSISPRAARIIAGRARED